MGQIDFDQYLIDLGLTQEIFCKAYKFSLDELGDINLKLRVTNRENRKGTFWQMQLFVDDFSQGINFCVSGYNESLIQRAVSQMKAKASHSSPPSGSKGKIQGAGPKKNKSFLQWLNKRINKKKAQKRKKELELEQAKERKKNLIPISLQAIESFQEIIIKDNLLEENYNILLKYSELLKEYSLKDFTKMKNKIDALIDFSKTQFSSVICSALEAGDTISLFNSDNELILKVKPEQRKFLIIEQYYGVVLNADYFHDFIMQYFKTEIFELVEKINRGIYIKKLKNFLSEIPEELDLAIKDLQKEFAAHWDNVYTLQNYDLTGFSTEILQTYGTQHFSFKRFHYEIETKEEFDQWFYSWIEQTKQYLSGPSIITDAVITILELIKSSPKYGVRTYAMWLGNSKAKILSDKRLDEKFRHRLKNYTIDQIAHQIDNIIDDDWLKVKTIGYYNNPVLTLTKTGQKILNKAGEKEIEPEKTEPGSVEQSVPAQKSVDIVELYPYCYLVKKIKNKDKTAWVDFLSTAQNILQIADWDQGQIKEISEALDNNMEGWKTLAKWKLIKHPVKYKRLERML